MLSYVGEKRSKRSSIELSNNIGERRCELKANEPVSEQTEWASGYFVGFATFYIYKLVANPQYTILWLCFRSGWVRGRGSVFLRCYDSALLFHAQHVCFRNITKLYSSFSKLWDLRSRKHCGQFSIKSLFGVKVCVLGHGKDVCFRTPALIRLIWSCGLAEMIFVNAQLSKGEVENWCGIGLWENMGWDCIMVYQKSTIIRLMDLNILNFLGWFFSVLS